MPEFTNPYDAVIADLEAKRADIDTALQLIKRLRDGLASAPTLAISTTQVPLTDLSEIPSDAFYGMTIVDAAIKFLRMSGRKPQPTKVIIDAFEHGALKGKKYATVYGVLNRRQQTDGDIVNIHGDWGLAEWYGTPKKKPAAPRQAISLNPDTFVQEDTAEAEAEAEAALKEMLPSKKAAG